MRPPKITSIWLAITFCLCLAGSEWGAVHAQVKPTIVFEKIVYQKPLDVMLGGGGIYFPRAPFSGIAALKLVEPIPTKKLAFTRPWMEIKVYDQEGQQIEAIRGYAYVYFILDKAERTAWDADTLGIYQYNPDKKVWEECDTRLLYDHSTPYGRLSVLAKGHYGLYGLAIQQ
jgi:hypothetical protein